mmetsp:Transcript_4108/g.8386  ORF Transcript_4108/g.8386 Transcript_4108/m.8386 type:complete len:108 (+) Transcript_4108:513-836(+)
MDRCMDKGELTALAPCIQNKQMKFQRHTQWCYLSVCMVSFLSDQQGMLRHAKKIFPSAIFLPLTLPQPSGTIRPTHRPTELTSLTCQLLILKHAATILSAQHRDACM